MQVPISKPPSSQAPMSYSGPSLVLQQPLLQTPVLLPMPITQSIPTASVSDGFVFNETDFPPLAPTISSTISPQPTLKTKPHQSKQRKLVRSQQKESSWQTVLKPLILQCLWDLDTCVTVRVLALVV
ncbi:hypothetical protein HID58_017923 [Brassica napus]|uniref:Uncharacterized protein n=1 Tax=Brassica napus TaxID=3708 RepID=A0ABQ8D8I4_BRANA|nr:hypothetical protein HID58_017923 [Brassica napus]